ncbi:unnamed protein product [Durusdinium trenchii]|uniref:Glycosyltransferase 2-like domain-containing protein n=1 Tax=Durusdinium trenchii TaxID=1381693 RepID=A0ABP0JZ44_9DINO
MAKRRKTSDKVAWTVGILLLLTSISCTLIIVLHNAGYDQAAAFPHRLGNAERKGLSAIIAVPGGRLAPAPCGEKGVLLQKSIEALMESAGDLLIEIIVVDDGTSPALERPEFTGMAWTDLKVPRAEEPDLFQGIRLLWLRFESPQGMALARTTGGDAARGEAIAFFDCYVKPEPGWATPAVELLRRSPRSVVVPALRDLDLESWESSGPLRFFDNVFTWEAETVQLYFDAARVTWPHPIDQSNVLIFSWTWWQEIGGYDKMMKGSSVLLTENIELSLRVLLCGGHFVPMNESVIGFCHQKHGTLHHERLDMLFNQARIIEAWFGPWTDEALKNPRFAELRPGSSGDLSEIRSMQENLKCSGLEQFLEIYRMPLEILGLLPHEVYSLRERSTGLCLQEWSKDEWALSKCDDSARGQLFCDKNERTEDQDDGTPECCSGIGPYKALVGSNSYCLDGRLGKPGPYGCIHRRPPNSQIWTLREDGQIFSEEWGCLVPSDAEAEELPTNEATWSSCRFEGQNAVAEQRFQVQDIEGTDFFRLVLATGDCSSIDCAFRLLCATLGSIRE